MDDRTLTECRILVVEDEYLLADEMQRTLEAAGAIVLGPTPDVAGALACLAREARVDGATLDINLGGEASYPVAEELLRLGIPFLFTTGYDHRALPDRYQHIARCEKPVRTAAVRDAIGRILHA